LSCITGWNTERGKQYMRWCIRLLSILFLLMNGQICLSQPPSGLWVAQRIDQRERGDDVSVHMGMTLIDKQGRERHRKLFIIRKDFDGKDKLLLKFSYPHDIKGTSFLVWEHKGRDNERFLYLPALGRIRRIATREKNENFAGTDFSYEDISGQKLEDYTYKLLKENILHREKTCYLLESYPKEKDSKYPKIRSWVRKDNFVTIKGVYYNKKGEVEKTYMVAKLEKIDGIWTVLEHSMENHKTEHKTLIKVKDVLYDKGILDRRFGRRALKR
jgi:hypothetical protein